MPQPTPPSTLQALNALVGEWSLQGSHPAEPGVVVRGRVAFEWLEGGFFLVERWQVERPEFPDGIAIIGAAAESPDSLSQQYFDSRGVARVYGLSLENRVWRLWRDGQPFSQRFSGPISDDGNSIAGRWETSSDGSTWEHDFDLTYTKLR